MASLRTSILLLLSLSSIHHANARGVPCSTPFQQCDYFLQGTPHSVPSLKGLVLNSDTLLNAHSPILTRSGAAADIIQSGMAQCMNCLVFPGDSQPVARYYYAKGSEVHFNATNMPSVPASFGIFSNKCVKLPFLQVKGAAVGPRSCIVFTV